MGRSYCSVRTVSSSPPKSSPNLASKPLSWSLTTASISWPRLENADYLMTAGSVESLIDAVRVAQVELLDWLVNDYGFDKWEGWQVISQAGTMRIGNIVDPNLTVVAKFPKALLKNV